MAEYNSVNLGRIMPKYTGDYSTNVSYNTLDIVFYEGNSYIAKQPSLRQTPAIDSEYWGLISGKGAKGDKGDTGPTGPKGDKGDTPDITVGGRNYILNSSGMNATESLKPTLIGNSGGVNDGSISYTYESIVITNNAPSSQYGWFYGFASNGVIPASNPIVSGQTYTLSLKVRGSVPQVALRWGSTVGTPSNAVKYYSISDKWTKIYTTLTFPEGAQDNFIRIMGAVNNQYLSGFIGNESFEFKEVKLEEGNIATDWTPAPEDIDSATAKAQSTADNATVAINNLSVGGRNLLLGTSDWSGGSTRWNQRGTVTTDTYRGMVVASTNKDSISPLYFMQNAGILQIGKTYTFSTYVRNTSDTDTAVAYYYIGGITTQNAYSVAMPAHTDWMRVYVTFKVVKDPATSTSGLRWESQLPVTNGYIQFAGYKVEEGNVATDWTPAPEDAPSNDSQLVHKTGNEVIAGDKTFTSNTTLATTTILAGNYGLRVTPSGFQKTTDGKTWVSANI